MNQEKEYLTINQLAKACSTSRASILRMEQDGILTPAYINPQNGYRYYDSENIFRVIRINVLQELGITHKEMKIYLDHPDNYGELLHLLQNKFQILEHLIGQLKLLIQQEPHLSISTYRFPSVYCYTRLLKNVTNLSTVRPQLWSTLGLAIKDGYSIDKNTAPFVTVDHQKIIQNNYKNTGYDYEICIPVLPSQKVSDLKHFDTTETISTVIYGGAKDTPLAFEQLLAEMVKRDLTSTGNARIVAAVNSFPGEEIPLEYWALQICFPV